MFRTFGAARNILRIFDNKSRKSIIGLLHTHSTSLQSQLPKVKKLGDEETEKLYEKLRSLIGEEFVSKADIVRGQHGQDEGPDQGEKPNIVVFAGSTEEVSEICKICYEDSIPIIPYGTGTGLEAGISALKGGVSIDMSRMAEIEEYNPQDFDVVVQPGVTRESLNYYTKDDGLWFPVDPGANASICGMCATGASGTNAVRYGTIKENCKNLEVVLSDGRILHTGGKGNRPLKSSAGYNLTNLFVGSEGTLGLITRATMKLHAQPEAVTAAVVSFPDIESAVNTVVTILQCSIPVARMELLDEVAVKACNAYSQTGLEESPTLFLEFHGPESALPDQTQFVADIANDFGGSEFQWATLQEDRTRLWTARHKLYYASLNLRPGCRSVTTDVAVPISKLPEILQLTREDIEKSGLVGPLLGHVGDGNFHAFLLFNPDEPDEYKKCKELSHRMAMRAIEMGGTCTGEHGIGTGKIGLLEAQAGPVGIDVMKQIKKALDPKGIMNPGKILNM